MGRAIWIGLLSMAAAGCMCGGPGNGNGGDDDGVGDCSDQDWDGFGVGPGCDGPDCDDWNPAVHTDAECDALCDVDPTSTGCECSAVEPVACYTGPADTQNVGPCVGSLRVCEDGFWQPCENQVLPHDEICNQIDDDCDATTDEGVTNECGTCGGDCTGDCVGGGAGCDDFDVDEDGNGVVDCEGREDCITLGGDTVSLEVIWIANSQQGSVSRVDTRTREEEARYYTGPADEATGYGFGYGGGDTHSALNPSRTSVNFWGDVVVGNRNFGGQPSVSKVLGSGCPDADRDGVVETSTGRDDLLEWETHDDWADECIAWHTDVGNASGIARAIAVQERAGLDGLMAEYAWIGIYSDMRYYEIDALSGEITGEEANCSPCTPYGAAIDRDGVLWSACLSQNMCHFDTEDTSDVEVLLMPSGSNYGITVDQNGDVWLGGTVTRYAPADEEWTTVPIGACDGFGFGGGLYGTGIASDGNGSIWVGGCSTGSVCRIDSESLECTQIMANNGSYGMAVDFDGYVWGIGMGQNNAAVIDPEDESVELVLNDCAGGGGYYGGTGCLVNPYTYSDMTGFQLRNATDPFGEYTIAFEGCGAGATTWTAISFEAETPVGSAIQFSVRTHDDLALLGAQPWVVIGTTEPLESPAPILDAIAAAGQAQGNYIEVQARLMSLDRLAKPFLLMLGAQYSCEGILK